MADEAGATTPTDAAAMISGAGPDTAGNDQTVDELAHEHGLPVSTVRLYQSKGLLPPPRKRGRVAYYGEEHRQRLRLITQLQERGFSLAAIKELADGISEGRSLAAVLGLGDQPSTWTVEAPRTMSIIDLMAALPGVEPTPELLQRVVELGLADLGDDGTVQVASPAFLDIGSRLVQMGVPGDTVLDEYEALRAQTDVIAERFTTLFRERFWDDFEADGLPAERLGELVGTLEQLGPLAEAVVTVALRQSLQHAADRFLAEQAERLGIELPRPGGG